MTSEIDTSYIFVGRDAEQQAFAATLGELAAGVKRGLFGKAQPSKKQARVFFIHGSGGMGKTELLRRFAQQCNEHGDHIAWVLLNWDDEHDAGRLPEDFRTFLVRLHNTIAEQLGADARKHFRAFAATHENHGKIEEKVTRERSAAYDKFVSTVAPLIGSMAGPTVSAALGVPAAAGFDKVVEAGVGYGVQFGAEGLMKFGEFLQDRLKQALLPDEYRLHTNPNDAYAESFVQGLVSLSQTHPLIIVQDTYEWISSGGQLDSQFRALIVKPAVRQSDTLVFVTAGRGDLSDEYRRSFQSDRHLLHVDAIKPFKAEETQALLQAYELPSNLSEEIQRKTLGVPLAVNTLIALRKQTDQEQVAAHFPDLEDVVDESDVIQQTTERFLRYIVETPQDTLEVAQRKTADRHHIYALALLRTDDPNALSACWGALDNGALLSPKDVTARRQELRRRNEFLFERNRDPMQKEVRHFVRATLRQQIQPDAGSFEREIVRRLNQTALDYYQRALAMRERSLPTLDERTEDAKWRSLCLDELNHKFWLDERDALQYLCRRLLEVGNVQTPYLSQLVQMAKDAQVDDQGLLTVLDEGTQMLLAEQPDLSAIQKMWDEIGRRLPSWKLPPLYRALLAYHRGRVLAASKKVSEAVQELSAGLDVLPTDTEPSLRKPLIEALVGCAAVLALGVRDYEQAIAVAQRALQYDPDNVRGQRIRVIGMMGLKDYEGSLALLNELIAEHPDVMDFWSARQMLYTVQGRDAEAQQEWLQIAKRRPEFVQDLVRVIVDQSKDPEARKAILEWGQDVGWSAQQVALYDRLQSALSPEILAELVGAQFKLMATENPTPEQILQTRELYARHLPNWPETQVDLGIAYLTAGRKDDAIAAFERAQLLAPHNPTLFTVPALVLFGRGHQAEARPFLEKSAQLLPDNPGPVLMMISYLFEQGRVDEAKARAEAALQTFPNVAMIRWMYGQILIASGDVEKGWQTQREAYLSDPASLEQIAKGLLFQSAWGLENLREKVKAELEGDVGEVLSQLPPEDMVRLYCEVIRARLAGSAVGEMNPNVLIPVLEELLRHRPESPELRLELSRCCEQTGDSVRAISLLTEVVEQAPLPMRDNLHHTLARLYFNMDEKEMTLRHLRQIAAPLKAPEYRILAGLLADAGEYGAAVDAYDKSLALEDDEDLERLSRFGVFNLAIERFERAEELLRGLLAKQPDNADAYHHLSEVLSSQKRYEEARSAGEKALTLSPDSPLPAARLARICQTMGLAEDAASYRQKALQSLPSVANYDQACVLAMLGQQDEALARLSNALKETPDLRHWAKHDPDFRELRTSVAFEQLIGS